MSQPSLSLWRRRVSITTPGRFSRALLAALALGWDSSHARAAAPGQGAGPPTAATVIAEERGGVVIRLEIPSIEWKVEGSYLRPSIRGFGVTKTPNRPELPIRIERVGIPAGAEPTMTVLEVEEVTGPQGLIVPAGTWVPIAPGAEEGIVSRAEDPTIYAADRFFPEETAVRLGEIGALREQPFVEVIYTPILHNPARRSTSITRAVTIRIDFGEVPAYQLPSEDAGYEEIYDLGLVNGAQARTFRGRGEPSRAELDEGAQLAAATAAPLSAKYKLTIKRNAIYRLGVSWVTTNAPGLLSHNPSLYRIECLGAQVPITVVDNGSDGTFNGSDYIEFYGQSLTWDILSPDEWNGGDYTDENVYWLYADSVAGLRAGTRAGNPTSGYPLVTDFTETIHHEVGDRFVALVPTAGVDHWYQDPPVTANPTPATQAFTVNTPGVAPGSSTGSIKVGLLGDIYFNNYHRTAILLNGSQISGPSDWDGFREFIHGVDDGPATYSQTLLNDGSPQTTTVTLSLPLGRTVGGNAITRDTVLLNAIDLTYKRLMRVDTDVNGDGTVIDDQMLILSVPNVNTQVRITGLAANAVAVYEITKSISGQQLAEAVRVTGTQITGASAPFTLDFQFALDGTLQPGTLRRFAVATVTAAATTGDLVPAAVETDVASNLHAPPTGADWLVIANASLLDAAPASSWQQLLTRRTSQGLRVKVVDIEDVYDEFSFGISDPQGIRDFIAYVYASWPRIDPNVPVRYVVLVGDGSYDYKNAYGYAPPRNLLSGYMRSVPGSAILGWMSDETYFSTVSGADPVPDVYLGRWPVHTIAETNAVAAKIIAYETQATGQSWQSQVVFVADDDEQSFEDVQDEQIETWLVGSPYGYHRTYEKQIALANPGWTQSQVAAEMRDRVRRQMNGPADPGRDIGPGTALLSYDGHGSWQVWGSNFSFFTTTVAPGDDVDALTNGSKLPFVVVGDCLSGAFAAGNRQGLPDLNVVYVDDMLITANRGAIGVLAPSHVTFYNAHALMADTFFASVFANRKIRNFGALTSGVQIAFAGTGDVETLRSLTLAADPAVNLIIPAPKPPTNVTATPGNHQVTLNWTASPQATSYNIYRAPTPNSAYTKIASNVVGTSYNATSLTNCSPYYFAVASVASGFEGAWSGFNDGCGTGGQCLTATPMNPSAPAVPTGVTAVDTETGGAIRVQWSANAAGDDVSEYRVHWGPSQGNYPNSVSAGLGTTYIVSGLTNGATYYFAVSGTNCSQGQGPKSLGLPAVPHRIEGIKPPNAIEDLRVTRSPDPGDGIDDALLQWTPPTTNIYGQPTTILSQEIYAGTTPNFPVDAAHRLITLVSAATSYIHENGVEDAPRHFYLVVAVDQNGYRTGASRELPQGIDQMTVQKSGSNLLFSWPPVQLDVDGRPTIISKYQLYGRATPFRRSDVTQLILIQGNIVGTSTSIPIPPGSAFFYSLLAVDNSGALSPW